MSARSFLTQLQAALRGRTWGDGQFAFTPVSVRLMNFDDGETNGLGYPLHLKSWQEGVSNAA
jgi:hypothetical protein